MVISNSCLYWYSYAFTGFLVRTEGTLPMKTAAGVGIVLLVSLELMSAVGWVSPEFKMPDGDVEAMRLEMSSERGIRIRAYNRYVATLLLARLRAANIKFGTAESLTAGLIGATFAEVSGSSSVLRGGVMSYHEEVKMEVLGVGSCALERCAVNEKTASAMAAGASRVLKSQLSVSVTGFAEPFKERGYAAEFFLGLKIGDAEPVVRHFELSPALYENYVG